MNKRLRKYGYTISLCLLFVIVTTSISKGLHQMGQKHAAPSRQYEKAVQKHQMHCAWCDYHLGHGDVPFKMTFIYREQTHAILSIASLSLGMGNKVVHYFFKRGPPHHRLR